jgi:hypothetical protein
MTVVWNWGRARIGRTTLLADLTPTSATSVAWA